MADALDRFVKLFESASAGTSGRFFALCGAGISVPSGLLSAQQFKDDFLDWLAGGEKVVADKLQKVRSLSSAEAFPFRFEGLMEVLNTTIDERMTVISKLWSQGPGGSALRSGVAHLALKKLIAEDRCICATTNFDGLLETTPSIRPFVVLTKDEWSRSPSPRPGLWYLHGRYDCLPAATLGEVYHVMQSPERKAFVSRCIQDLPALVLGYSGQDDFDVSLWLREIDAPPRCTYWVQFAAGADKLLESKNELLNELKSQRLEPGLMHLISAWSDKGYLNNLVVLLTETPDAVLARLAGIRYPASPDIAPSTWQKDAGWGTSDVARALDDLYLHGEAKPLGLSGPLPRDWITSFVGGSLFLHLYYLRDSIQFLESALALAQSIMNEPRCIVRCGALLARASTEIIDNSAREKGLRIIENIETVLSQHAGSIPTDMAVNVEAELNIAAALVKRFHPTHRDRDCADKLLRQVAANSDVRPALRSYASMRILEASRHENRLPSARIAGYEDLQTLAKWHHEEGRQRWLSAADVGSLTQARNECDTAQRLAKGISDVSGYCNSTNVIGLIYHRIFDVLVMSADTTSLDEVRNSSKKFHELSLRAAASRNSEWHVTQAHEALASWHLRLGRDHQECANHLAALGTDIDGMRLPDENAKLALLRSLNELLAFQGTWSEFVKFGKSRFPAEPYTSLTANDALGRQAISERVRLANAVNSVAFLKIGAGRKGNLEEELGTIPGIDVSTYIAQRPYWRKRLAYLDGLVNEISAGTKPSVGDLVFALFDWGGP